VVPVGVGGEVSVQTVGRSRHQPRERVRRVAVEVLSGRVFVPGQAWPAGLPGAPRSFQIKRRVARKETDTLVCGRRQGRAERLRPDARFRARTQGGSDAEPTGEGDSGHCDDTCDHAALGHRPSTKRGASVDTFGRVLTSAKPLRHPRGQRVRRVRARSCHARSYRRVVPGWRARTTTSPRRPRPRDVGPSPLALTESPVIPSARGPALPVGMSDLGLPRGHRGGGRAGPQHAGDLQPTTGV
jgi:hypothetical protein